MSPPSFVEYALSGNLSLDETYTVELLIDRVRSKFDPTYWDTWSEAGDAREVAGYQPHFAAQHVEPAARELEKVTWLSLQRTNPAKRPVRDLRAIGCLPNITTLVLTENEVSDLTPLQRCRKLTKLLLKENPTEDLSALRGCEGLEEIELDDIPSQDLTPLAALAKLRILSITTNQLPALRRVKRLPALNVLKLGIESFESFAGFPEMPALRVIQGAHVQSLEGLQAYPQLFNLVNLSGSFTSLEPLRNLRQLTHVNILESRVASLEPLSGLVMLRALFLSSTVKKPTLSR